MRKLTLSLILLGGLLLSCSQVQDMQGHDSDITSIELSEGRSLNAPGASITGPLGTPELVKGRKLGVSYFYYDGTSTLFDVKINYGFYNGQLTTTEDLDQTGYGNYIVYIDVPSDAQAFYYEISRDAVVLNNDGAPYEQEVKASAVSVALHHGDQLNVSYAGPRTSNQTFIHQGWNGWANASTQAMQHSYYSYPRAGQYYDFNSINLTIPAWANSVDFVFTSENLWDNNDGQDWSQSIRPFIKTSFLNSSDGKKFIGIDYANGNLSPVVVHYGFDGWQNVSQKGMDYFQWTEKYGTVVEVPGDAQVLNFVFTDGKGNWNNNNGQDWSLDLQ